MDKELRTKLKEVIAMKKRGINLFFTDNDRYKGDSGAEKIDETIELLQQTISFNIPLLLKPIYDIKNPDSCFLVCKQLGAINNITRAMIEMGILNNIMIIYRIGYRFS